MVMELSGVQLTHEESEELTAVLDLDGHGLADLEELALVYSTYNAEKVVTVQGMFSP